MSAPSGTSISLETAVTELSLAIGQVLRRLRTESNPDGLTWSQTVALSRLKKAGPMTTADLARAESVKPQSMGATLAELEREGLVERQPHPTDGRQVLFALTDQGLEARRKRSAAKQQWLLAAMAKLDPGEQRTLVSAAALMTRLAAAPSGEPLKYHFRIDSQPLGTALQQFAEQSGVQIIFFSQVMEGLQAPALNGSYTIAGALEMLLSGSHLIFRVINPKTIKICWAGSNAN